VVATVCALLFFFIALTENVIAGKAVDEYLAKYETASEQILVLEEQNSQLNDEIAGLTSEYFDLEHNYNRHLTELEELQDAMADLNDELELLRNQDLD
jgi:septal ring factor EnvC (AmiA/AmiB activator)